MLELDENEITYYYNHKNPETQKLDYSYYSCNNVLYAPTFPEEWAKSHITRGDEGSIDCRNCGEYGSWNGVFIGYCVNCAIHVYKGKRGYGMGMMTSESTRSIEISKEYFEELSKRHYLDEIDLNSAVSAFDTYLKNVDLDTIGDINTINLKKKEKEEEELNTIIKEMIERENKLMKYNDEAYEEAYELYVKLDEN